MFVIALGDQVEGSRFLKDRERSSMPVNKIHIVQVVAFARDPGPPRALGNYEDFETSTAGRITP
jgi:hypothetical protein